MDHSKRCFGIYTRNLSQGEIWKAEWPSANLCLPVDRQCSPKRGTCHINREACAGVVLAANMNPWAGELHARQGWPTWVDCGIGNSRCLQWNAPQARYQFGRDAAHRYEHVTHEWVHVWLRLNEWSFCPLAGSPETLLGAASYPT